MKVENLCLTSHIIIVSDRSNYQYPFFFVWTINKTISDLVNSTLFVEQVALPFFLYDLTVSEYDNMHDGCAWSTHAYPHD